MPNRPNTGEDAVKTMGGNFLSDPSSLTTQQLWREIASLKELVLTRIGGIENAISIAHEDMVRFPTDVQKAVGTLKELHEEKINKCGVLIAEHRELLLTKIAEQHTLDNERFNKVYARFDILEDARKEMKTDTNVAIDRAFSASKEAVSEQNKSNALAISKSESSTQKQIDQLELNSNSGRVALDNKITDIKDRVLRLEGMGGGPSRVDSQTIVRLDALETILNKIVGGDVGKRETSASVGAIVGYIFGAIGIIIAIISLVAKMLPSAPTH